MDLKTPLYDTHVKYNGKIVPFAGYLLPVQYQTGVIEEHMAVRTGCGMFDVSHMGEIICKGTDALKNLQMLLTNDFTNSSLFLYNFSYFLGENPLLIINSSLKSSNLSFINLLNSKELLNLQELTYSFKNKEIISPYVYTISSIKSKL